MAHKAMIGGAVYEVGGGKAMIGGAVCEISHGKTMLNGAVYEVGFAEMVTVSVLASPGTTIKLMMTINGERYTSLTNINVSLTIPVGSEIIFTNTSMGNVTAYVTDKNGVQTSTSLSKFGTYSYTVIGNTNIQLDGKYTSVGPGSYDTVPTIYITET